MHNNAKNGLILKQVPIGVSLFRILLKRFLKVPLSLIGMAISQFKPPGRGIRILFYHRVNSFSLEALGPVSREVGIHPQTFEQQLCYLKEKGFQTIGSEDLIAIVRDGKPSTPKTLLITFDDGYEDNLLFAVPLLKKYGFKAIVFVTTGLVGSETGQHWEYGDPPGFGKFLNWKQVKNLSESGIEIGSHTCHHLLLTQQTEEVVSHELVASKDQLERELGGLVELLAYPGGDYDEKTLLLAEGAGYKIGLTTVPGINTVNTDPFLLHRTEVSASDSFFLFKMKLGGYLDWLAIKESKVVRRFIGWMTDLTVTFSNWVKKPGKLK